MIIVLVISIPMMLRFWLIYYVHTSIYKKKLYVSLYVCEKCLLSLAVISISICFSEPIYRHFIPHIKKSNRGEYSSNNKPLTKTRTPFIFFVTTFFYILFILVGPFLTCFGIFYITKNTKVSLHLYSIKLFRLQYKTRI